MRTRHRLVTVRWSGSGTMRLVKSPLSGEPNATSSRYLSRVRTVAVAIAVSLVMAVSAPAPARASTAELVQQLDGLVASFPGGAGIWVADANIDATLEKAGIKNFHVALDDSEDNWVTPRAVGTFFTLLARRQLISAAASDRMLSRLERQQINDRLPAQLPADVVIAHKTGNLSSVTHDAGIIFTKTGPRVVVALTWDAPDEEAANFISSVGSLVYSANLQPAANARYQVAKTAIAVDVATDTHVTVPITNIGTRAWTATGPGAVGLIWDMNNAQGALLMRSPKALPL